MMRTGYRWLGLIGPILLICAGVVARLAALVRRAEADAADWQKIARTYRAKLDGHGKHDVARSSGQRPTPVLRMVPTWWRTVGSCGAASAARCSVPDRPSPLRLWDQAMGEHPNDLYARRRRYHDLMVEHGHIEARSEERGARSRLVPGRSRRSGRMTKIGQAQEKCQRRHRRTERCPVIGSRETQHRKWHPSLQRARCRP
jgi:hypothetical protein